MALRLTGENIQEANQVVLPPELLSPFPASSLSEEPSTTSESACRTRMHARMYTEKHIGKQMDRRMHMHITLLIQFKMCM